MGDSVYEDLQLLIITIVFCGENKGFVYLAFWLHMCYDQTG